ncbi:NlpC/P60 family protein [Streptomyces sp. NPDC090022]|uniref:C40 family peptidase n=1 Tax=Streptomyces sp. NPDC090022 TaxID=3365920 RepID=UPI00382852A3
MSRRALRAVCVAAALAATLPVPAATAEPGAGVQDVGRLLVQLQGLYQRAEEAAEAYKATEIALTARAGEERRLTSELGAARTALDRERAAAGRLAREQYQASRGLSPYARILLSGDPQAALDERRFAVREAAHRAAVIGRLTRGEQRADALAARARRELGTQQTLAARKKQYRDEARAQLGQVERLLASLTTEQLTALSAKERSVTMGAQRALEASGRLGTVRRAPTAAGGAALRFAVAQLGKPYVWGAEGPAAFDCSGLTSQAWAAAGRAIPRTSQEQWAQLPRVPLDELRPGDLVVYFPKATHVAIYAGDGKVIQAPRPGAAVKVSPIAANPLLGAVRPDPDGLPLARYTPAVLPESASAGSDDGYSAEEAPDTSAR